MLMTTSINPKFFPKLRQSFSYIFEKTNFLYFCTITDQITKESSNIVLGKCKMEVGWAQFLMRRYGAVTYSDAIGLIGQHGIRTEESARTYVKKILSKAIENVCYVYILWLSNC
jgi:hypothetical protein